MVRRVVLGASWVNQIYPGQMDLKIFTVISDLDLDLAAVVPGS